MIRAITFVLFVGCCGALPTVAQAQLMTGLTGDDQPFTNLQPSLALNEFVQSRGVFPSRNGGGIADGAVMGQVRLFAGNFSPGGFPQTDGQLLPISQNAALFSILGTTYGGDGRTTFGLPDLRGRTVVHEGTGPGLDPWSLGQRDGAENNSLSETQMPVHNHSLPSPLNMTGVTGGSDAFSNMQPSLGLNYIVAMQGLFPSRDGGTGGQTFLGQVSLFAGNFAPSGWAFADGQLIQISQNTALFSILGTTYGGDGRTTFGLPDLRGRAAVHKGTGPGLNPWSLGQRGGTNEVTLTENELSAHTHTFPPDNGLTGESGSGGLFSNMQPSLGINHLIALQGVFPSRDGGAPGETILGEVVSFAGTFAPAGWAFAEGQLLPISQNSALFSLLGTTYGGDGRTTFALPDLRGQTVVHKGTGPGLEPWSLGQRKGAQNTSLTIGNLPSHLHSVPVPEPSSFVLIAICVATILLAMRQKAYSPRTFLRRKM